MTQNIRGQIINVTHPGNEDNILLKPCVKVCLTILRSNNYILQYVFNEAVMATQGGGYC